MRFKTNLVIGTIFLGLLAFVYFYEIKGGEKRQAAAEKSKKVFDVGESEVKRLSLGRGDTLVVLEKREDRWWLVEPVETEADQEAVERYVRNLGELQQERVLEDSARVRDDPGLAARYRLQSPRLTVALNTATGALDTLRCGGDSPTEKFAYMQRSGANPEIFAVLAWRFDNLNKGVFDLRDRRALAFETASVGEIRLTQPAGQVVLAKAEDGQWRLRAPLLAAADRAAVDKILDNLRSAEARAFVEERPGREALERYGLSGPGVTEVSLLVGQDRAEKRLRLGHADPGGARYYAQDASRAPVFLVDSTLAHQLQRPASELRDRKPLGFEHSRITRLELHRRGETIAAAKDTAGNWTLLALPGRRANSWKLDGLLNSLEQTQVEEFVADGAGSLAAYGLDQPQVEILLWAGEEKVLEVRLRKAADGKVYLTRLGMPSVYRVEQKVLDELSPALDDLSQPAPQDSTGSG